MTEKIFKSALTLTLGFAVCAYADPFHSETFETYVVDTAITNQSNTTGSWAGGADDESKVVEANGEKYLALNTNGGDLTNTLSNAADINNTLETGAVYFEAKVKFVPSDSLVDCSSLEDSDAKFAIYALAEDNGPTNLVVFHKYYDSGINDYGYTNEAFSVSAGLAPDVETTVHVVLTNYNGSLAFSVQIGEDVLVSQSPFTVEEEDPETFETVPVQPLGNTWMGTVNGSLHNTISSICFKGTGSVDDIVVDAATVTPTTVNVTVTGGANATAVWTVDGTTVSAPATLTEGQTYSVVYTANQGYKFAQGATTEFSGTVGTTDIAITAPNAIALAVVTVTVTGGANATAAWTVDGATVSAPATLTEGQTYSVVYTANQGYEFAQGATTTASGTAGTENIVIAIADATAIQQAGWVDDSSTIPANTPAGTQYPALADSALATADAKKLTDWAKAKNIDFATVDADTEGTLVDAFLLNCTQAQVEAEAAAFVLNITFNNGVPVVTTPADRNEKTYNVTPVLKGKAALTDAEWTTINDSDENTANDTADFNFFKAELSL